MWKRRQNWLDWLWGTSEFEARQVARSGFVQDEPRVGIVENGLFLPLDPASNPLARPVKYEKPYKKTVRCVLCYAIVLVMISATVISTLGVMSFNVGLRKRSPVIGPIVGAVFVSALMSTYSTIYQDIALRLTLFENHRTKVEFEDSLCAKRFLFEFFNSYFFAFYIAFIKGFNLPIPFFGVIDQCRGLDGKPAADCMQELFLTLSIVYCTRFFVNRGVEVVKP